MSIMHRRPIVLAALAIVGCASSGSPMGNLETGDGHASGSASSGQGEDASGAAESSATGDGADTTTEGSDGESGVDGAFTLLFRDDFDTFDTTRWQAMTHSWDTNLALFGRDAVEVVDGELVLTLLPAPEGTVDDTGAEKPFLGAEVRSRDTLTYGRVRARAKFARGSAVVSSLVTIYTPWPADNWNELDIESLGRNTEELQFNAMVYTGDLPATTKPVSPTQHPELQEVGFDVSEAFHEYTIEWTPTAAEFSIDGTVVHRWEERIELMNLPQNVLLTIWASSSASWAGSVDDTTPGARAVYDWVELWTYDPS